MPEWSPWDSLRCALIVAFCGIVGYTDARWHKIYNWSTFPAMLLGLALGGVQGGGKGFVDSLAGLVGGGFLLYLPFALNLVKAGDVKFLAALGALGGFWFAVACVLYGSFLHGLLALGVLLARGELLGAMRNIGRYLYALFVLRVPGEFQAVSKGVLPHGLTLGGGALGALLLRWVWGSYFPFIA